jgi:hypothetical protein
MGIRFTCPNGHKLHVKAFLAGKRGVCPHCGEKFVIPAFEGELQQSSVRRSHDVVQGLEPLGSTRIVTPTDTASQSIIIAVAEDRLSSAAPVDGGPSTPPVMETTGPRRNADSPALPMTQSPAWYISRRERLRRNQLTMAIMLLVAVIVLALVLILVLRRGSSQSSAHEPNSHRPADPWRRPPPIALVDHDLRSRRVPAP